MYIRILENFGSLEEMDKTITDLQRNSKKRKTHFMPKQMVSLFFNMDVVR